VKDKLAEFAKGTAHISHLLTFAYQSLNFGSRLTYAQDGLCPGSNPVERQQKLERERERERERRER
jgi:hypothetical protein